MEEFIKLVQEMRATQEEYFKTRKWAVLEKAKILERRVDYVIKKYFDNQLSLFDDENND